MELLTDERIQRQLADLRGWTYREGKLRREFKRANFKDALGFIVRIGLAAETLNHHPEIFNVYSRVEIALETHDAGGVTEKDFVLARQIEELSQS
jgi:4a-hydroxytetrahydrobiopterin dehydratase